jgi:hypothetical protein
MSSKGLNFIHTTGWNALQFCSIESEQMLKKNCSFIENKDRSRHISSKGYDEKMIKARKSIDTTCHHLPDDPKFQQKN